MPKRRINDTMIGINSAFDLFGVNGVSLEELKKRNSKRQRKNSVSHDFATVGKAMAEAMKVHGGKSKS